MTNDSWFCCVCKEAKAIIDIKGKTYCKKCFYELEAPSKKKKGEAKK